MIVLFLFLSYGASTLPPLGGESPMCIGEYQHCPEEGDCVLFECSGRKSVCPRNHYQCPISNACVKSAEDLSSCPGLRGTHLDHTLDIETRLDKLVAAANLTDMISQLTNAAPALVALGIPAYNYLSDDEHGVRGWRSTYFPDGPGLGASFDKEMLYEIGGVVGTEARALHNFLTHTTGMRDNAFNGDGITLYGPNMNLVRCATHSCQARGCGVLKPQYSPFTHLPVCPLALQLNKGP